MEGFLYHVAHEKSINGYFDGSLKGVEMCEAIPAQDDFIIVSDDIFRS